MARGALIPCKECVALAACRQKIEVDCLAAFNYLRGKKHRNVKIQEFLPNVKQVLGPKACSINGVVSDVFREVIYLPNERYPSMKGVLKINEPLQKLLNNTNM